MSKTNQEAAAKEAALREALGKLREEYRRKMNNACDMAQQAAQTEEMDKVSLYSTESERNREAFHALNRAIALVDAHADTSALLASPRQEEDAQASPRIAPHVPKPTPPGAEQAQPSIARGEARDNHPAAPPPKPAGDGT